MRDKEALVTFRKAIMKSIVCSSSLVILFVFDDEGAKRAASQEALEDDLVVGGALSCD